MRRINDAIVYFRKWPSLKSQKDAIKGLEELSTMAAKECIDEFNRLMRTVGPAVQFQASVPSVIPLSNVLWGGGGVVSFRTSWLCAKLSQGDDARESLESTMRV